MDQPATNTNIPTVTRRAFSSKKIDMGKALVLRFCKGLSYQEIANQFGCNKQAVQQRFKALPDILSVQNYEAKRSKLLSAVELALGSQLLDSTKLKKASLNNVAYSFGQIHHARRLEDELSTSNIAYAEIIQAKHGLSKSIEDLITNYPEYIDVEEIDAGTP